MFFGTVASINASRSAKPNLAQHRHDFFGIRADMAIGEIVRILVASLHLRRYGSAILRLHAAGCSIVSFRPNALQEITERNRCFTVMSAICERQVPVADSLEAVRLTVNRKYRSRDFCRSSSATSARCSRSRVSTVQSTCTAEISRAGKGSIVHHLFDAGAGRRDVLVKSARPPGRSLMTAVKPTSRPSATSPRSITRLKTLGSMLPPQSSSTHFFRRIV